MCLPETADPDGLIQSLSPETHLLPNRVLHRTEPRPVKTVTILNEQSGAVNRRRLQFARARSCVLVSGFR